jgi:hypothetical protein
MSNLPGVVVHVQSGETTVYCGRTEVNTVILHWKELEYGSQGLLCELYKDLWALGPNSRSLTLHIVIAAIKKRFPIKAKFHPQRFKTAEKIEPDGPPIEFDVTEALLKLGPDYIDNLRDVHYPTDELADGLPERQAHDGPFAVEIKKAAMEFLFAPENEEEAEKLAEAERAKKGYASPEEKAAMEKLGYVFRTPTTQDMSPNGLAEIQAQSAARRERAARGAATRKKNREAKKKEPE